MLFRLSDVWKSYGGTEILKGVSFQVNPSEKVGLVGRNGAGKTTVFRLVTGQEAPDDGEVIKMNGLKLGLLDQHVDFGEAETVHTAALSAFKEIHDIEAEMRQLEKTMETDHSEAILHKYADLQTAFEHADGFSYAARAEAVLLGLGFPPETWGEDVRTLSGGGRNERPWGHGESYREGGRPAENCDEPGAGFVLRLVGADHVARIGRREILVREKILGKSLGANCIMRLRVRFLTWRGWQLAR